MTRYRIRFLPVLAAAALLLSGCGAQPIDPATAGDLQAEVRTIAATAAGGDTIGAIALAERLRAEVDGAREAGTVNEDRASLIGMHIDAVIASLRAAAEPTDGATAGNPPPEPAPAGTSGPPAPAETIPTPADVAPESPEPTPVPASELPAAPAPGEADENEADENEPDEDAGGGGAADQGGVTPGNGGQGADKAAEQQRKAAEKAAEQARKEAERAAEKAADDAGGRGNGG